MPSDNSSSSSASFSRTSSGSLVTSTLNSAIAAGEFVGTGPVLRVSRMISDGVRGSLRQSDVVIDIICRYYYRWLTPTDNNTGGGGARDEALLLAHASRKTGAPREIQIGCYAGRRGAPRASFVRYFSHRRRFTCDGMTQRLRWAEGGCRETDVHEESGETKQKNLKKYSVYRLARTSRGPSGRCCDIIIIVVSRWAEEQRGAEAEHGPHRYARTHCRTIARVAFVVVASAAAAGRRRVWFRGGGVTGVRVPRFAGRVRARLAPVPLRCRRRLSREHAS